MPDNETVTLQPVTLELVKIEATVPEPDSLITGSGINCADSVTIETTGEYKRGTLLMKATASAKFVKATKAGLASAVEIAILCDDVTIETGEYADTLGYFTGEFNREFCITIASKVLNLPAESLKHIHVKDFNKIIGEVRNFLADTDSEPENETKDSQRSSKK